MNQEEADIGNFVNVDNHNSAGSSSIGLEAEASTSAVSLGGSESSIYGLRERQRAPYSSAVTPRKEDLKGDISQPNASSKGKEREVDQADVKDDNATDEDGKKDALFACHICLETPSVDDCVVTKCGHVFCWSDLSAWLDSNPPATSQCPVCKSLLKDVQEDVIPIYSGGRSNKKEVDPRTRPRPKPKVTPAPPPLSGLRTGGAGLFSGGMQGISPFWDIGGGPGGGNGWSVQAGVFPFPGLSFAWNSNAATRHTGTRLATSALGDAHPEITAEQAQEQARLQQRNALIAFVVMIILFTLLATISDMD